MLTRLATICLFLSLPAHADWYVGANVGASDTSDYCEVDEYADENIECRRGESSSFRFHIGHEFSRYFRSEVYFADLGSASVDDQGVAERETGSIAVGGFGIALMPSVPVGDADLYLRGGLMRSYISEHKVKRLRFLFRDSDAVPTYGLGIRYRFSDRLSARMEVENFHIDSHGAEIDIQTATIGVSWALQ